MSKRNCRRTVLLTLAALPLLIWAALRVETNTDDIRIWLPDGTPERLAYQQFTDRFGNDGEVILSWPGCTTDDPRLHEFVSRLTASNRNSKLFASIISGETMLSELASKKFSYSSDSLRQRLSGIFFDPSDQTTAVIAQLSDNGRQNGRRCVDEIYYQVSMTNGLAYEDVRIGGDVYTTVQIDRATNRALAFAIPSILLATLITLICLRSLRLTVATLSAAGISALISVALVSICGFKINGLLVIMPVLILVLSLSATVHLCSYFRRAVKLNKPDPVRSMLEHGCRPCLLAIVTTAIGVGMLYTSHIQAVRLFGLFSALGLLLSLVPILIVFPAILRIWPARAWWPTIALPSTGLTLVNRLGSLSNPVRAATLIVLICLAASPILMYGLGHIVTTLQPEKMFTSRNIVNQHRDWLENKFSTMNSIDLIATFDDSSESSNLVDQIRHLKTIQNHLVKLDEVNSTFSIANICRLPSETKSAKTIIQEEIIDDALRADQQSLADHRLMAASGGSISWRIRLGIDVEDNPDSRQLVKTIEEKCHSVTKSLDNGPTTSTTGIWLLTSAGRSHVLRDLATSFVLAFFIITPLIMIVLRGFTVGLIAMIPNVLPAMSFFGLIGLLGIEIDIGTLLTASVGLGIAVDDTLHFIHCFVQSRRVGNRQTATIQTIKQCFRPMLYTTLICAGGLSMFVFSEFLPARQFVIAIVALLGLALICDLVVLPALIISPIGRFFESVRVVEPVIIDASTRKSRNVAAA